MSIQSHLQIANFITLKARAGKAQALAAFLSQGAAAVHANEPHTHAWYAVQIDAETFAIIDFFADIAGQDAHVAGQVAANLKAQAAELIEGGWEDGVLANFKVFKVLSAAHQA